MLRNKVLNNTAWIVGCRLVQSVLSLIVGMLTARYLGPSGYGLISYAGSVVAFFVPLMRMGLHATLVQEITSGPEHEGKTLGTALVVNLFSSVLCVLGVLIFSVFTNRGDKTAVTVCIIYSLSLLFQAAEMITYWFQAKLLSKYPSIATLIAYCVVSAYRIFLLVTQRSIYWFAWSAVIEHGIISILLLAVYCIRGEQHLAFSGSLSRKMLSVSKYYILPNLMITIFQQTDRLMLKLMLSETATGYYSAAVTCAGMFGFVYAAIIDSFRPGILMTRKISLERFERQISCLYSLVFYLSMIQCLLSCVGAKWIILILYGEEYMPAVNALRICVWYVTYAYFGMIRGIWILSEGKHNLVWVIDVFGAVMNVMLNLLLIPKWGINGAAAASFVSQFTMNFVFGFIYQPIRQNNKLMIKGLNPCCLTDLKRIFE